MRSLESASGGGIVHLKKGITWKQVYQKHIQVAIYDLFSRLMTKRALSEFNLKQLRVAEKVIELRDEAREELESMARYEELENGG